MFEDQLRQGGVNGPYHYAVLVTAAAVGMFVLATERTDDKQCS
ncbi:hypothetical protein SAMN05216374_4009 [Tardiphaga sp. OK246]|jgi:hypothetical protein|nr:hypothetical protein SAMN05216374_4009 [Tardiphaga sp. OK246]